MITYNIIPEKVKSLPENFISPKSKELIEEFTTTILENEKQKAINQMLKNGYREKEITSSMDITIIAFRSQFIVIKYKLIVENQHYILGTYYDDKINLYNDKMNEEDISKKYHTDINEAKYEKTIELNYLSHKYHKSINEIGYDLKKSSISDINIYYEYLANIKEEMKTPHPNIPQSNIKNPLPDETEKTQNSSIFDKIKSSINSIIKRFK